MGADDCTTTLQAFREGCFRDAWCYDATGALWPIVEATLREPPAVLSEGGGRLRRSLPLPPGPSPSISYRPFGVARTPAELEAVYRLRCAVVIDQGWGRAEDFPDGSERDPFDERAIQVVAWDDGTLLGTMRLVVPVPGLVLPTEQAFDLIIATQDRVIDMGRTCRAPCRRDRGQHILWGLLCQAWIELRARGFVEICGIFSPAMVRFYRRLGFRVGILGEARSHWGQDRHPMLVRPEESIDSVRRFQSLHPLAVPRRPDPSAPAS